MKLIILLIIIISCARSPIKDRDNSLRYVEDRPQIMDDMDLDTLVLGIEDQIKHLKKRKSNLLDFRFGSRVLSANDYLSALNFLVSSYKKDKTRESFFKIIDENFEFYEVYGRDDWGDVFITSYYEPIIEGSFKKTEKFSQALYMDPKDIVEVDLRSFVNKDYGIDEDIPLPSKLYGRLTDNYSVRGNPVVQAYYSREEIDSKNVFQGDKLECCYVDPVDAFFLQIQGSGTIKFSKRKKIRLGYASQNGRRYVSIGSYLTDVIPKEEMNLHSIETYLRSLSKEKMQDILNLNPSYVFFRKLDGRPITTLGTEVVDGRTIATDMRYFPKGALAFLIYDRPVFISDNSDEHTFLKSSRFVLDQDTGGAINGPGRLDLFWGKGEEAKRYAGVMKGNGKLYYLAPKNDLLIKLKDLRKTNP